MEKYQFSPVNWDKIQNGTIGLSYSKGNLLADMELFVERAEARKKGIPDDYPIATHVWIPLWVISEYTITKSTKFLFWKRDKTIHLTPGLWIFEETASGIEISPAIKYYDSTNIEILKRVEPFTPEQILTFQDSVIKYWQESLTYGYFAFFFQPEHTFLNTNVISKVNPEMMICSEYAAVVVNDTCKAGNQKDDFPNPANTNPLEWQMNENWVRDTEIQ